MNPHPTSAVCRLTVRYSYSPGVSLSLSKVGDIEFPSYQFWCWTLVWIQKLKTFQGKAEHSPPRPTVPYKSVSGGILWSSLELKQGSRPLQSCLVSPSTLTHCKGMGCYYNSHSYFDFELLFFSKISHFFLFDQRLSHSCTMNVLRMASNSWLYAVREIFSNLTSLTVFPLLIWV